METGERALRWGMVGGGQGGFIGYVHRLAARLDGRYRLVAGALSSRGDVNAASGEALGLDPYRVYPSFAAMASAEARRDDGIEVVSIVTPNHLHVPPAKAFLEAGIHVVCDKPLASSLADARELAGLAVPAGTRILLTHNYTGYPMVRQARALVMEGALGPIRTVQVEYAQDWLTEAAELQGAKGAEWRTDPARSGAGGAIGDIGTHAYNLLRFVTGIETEELAADLTSFVPGRQLDDNVQILLRMAGGVRGMLWASQVAVGNENELKLRVYGERGGLEWCQSRANELLFTRFGEPTQRLTRGGPVPGGKPAAGLGVRVPGGHPEGYLEAFATLYRQFADVIAGREDPAAPPLPSLADGVEGMAFIEAAVLSSRENARWTRLDDV